MKLTPWMLTVAAFAIIALLAVGFLLKKLWAQEVVEAPAPESRTLPMALAELEPGTVITRAHIGNGPWLKASELAPDTFTTIEGVLGRIVKEQISPASPLRSSMFYAPGDQPDLNVAEGKRAVTIRVSETTAVLNQKLKPGQYVDVQLTVDGLSGGQTRLQSTGGSVRNASDYGNAMTATLFKGVKLVTMNRSNTTTSLQASESSNVTLELDEVQARIALLAQQKGEIDLIYNPNGEGTGGIEIKSENDRVTFYELLGLKEEAEKAKPFKSEHYRGSGHSNLYFQDGSRVGGWGDAGDSSSGVPLSNTSGDWTTDTNPAGRNQNVAQQPTAATGRE